MRRALLPFATFVFTVLGLLPGWSWAQNQPRPMGAQVQREPARGAGTIKGPSVSGLEVVAGGGERYFVQIEPRAQHIEFLGSAEVSWLHPGLFVRFNATVDKRGRILEPITQLDVITLRDGYQLGVVADSGLNNNDEGPGLFQDPKPEKPAKKAPPPDNMPVTILGRLTEVKNGKFQVAVPGSRPVKGELAENVKISIEYGNLSLVKPGDKIDFQGWSPAGMKQMVYASQITVTAAQPLVGESRKKPRVEPKDDGKGDEKDAGKESAPPGGEKKSEKKTD